MSEGTRADPRLRGLDPRAPVKGALTTLCGSMCTRVPTGYSMVLTSTHRRISASTHSMSNISRSGFSAGSPCMLSHPSVAVHSANGRAHAHTRIREGSATYEMQLTAYPSTDSTFVPSKSNGVPNISFDCVCAEHGPVPVQMWQGWAQFRCRCGRGRPSPGADVAGVGPVPVQMSERRAVVQSLWVDLTDAFVRSDTREDCRAKAPDLVGHVQVQ